MTIKQRNLVRIYPTDRNNKKDKRLAKQLEKVFNDQQEKYKGIVDAIVSARNYIEEVYMIQTPDDIYDRILEEVIRLEIGNMKESN